jgi:hypothetical protein
MSSLLQEYAANTSLSENADHYTNVQSFADALLSPKENCQVESAPVAGASASAVASKVAQRN